MKPFTIFILVGAIVNLVNIVTIMGPVNPLAAIGAFCYGVLAIKEVIREDWC